MKKNIFVSGISKGIGKAIAIHFLEEGHNVYGVYNTGSVEAQELNERYSNLRILQCDFTDRTQTMKLIANISEVSFDVVVNNAGMIEFEEFENFDFTIWDRTFEVNLHAPLLLSIKLATNMRKGSKIINIASTDGMTGTFSSMAYSASKAALINLTKSLSNNLASKNICVNAVAPGWINTGMSTEESYEAAQLTPLGRNGSPEDVADLVSYLSSDKSNFITGATIVIDGGYTNTDYIMMKEAGKLL